MNAVTTRKTGSWEPYENAFTPLAGRLVTYCQETIQDEDERIFFITNAILFAVEQDAVGKSFIDRTIEKEGYFWILSTERLKGILLAAQQSPRWAGSDGEVSLKNPREVTEGAGFSGVFKFSQIASRNLRYLEFVKNFPGALSNPEVQSEIFYSVDKAANPYNFGKQKGYLESILAFIHDHPKLFESQQQHWIGEALKDSIAEGRTDSFNRLFLFVKAHPILFSNEKFLSEVIEALKWTARRFSKYHQDRVFAKTAYDQIVSCLEEHKILETECFQTELRRIIADTILWFNRTRDPEWASHHKAAVEWLTRLLIDLPAVHS